MPSRSGARQRPRWVTAGMTSRHTKEEVGLPCRKRSDRRCLLRRRPGEGRAPPRSSSGLRSSGVLLAGELLSYPGMGCERTRLTAAARAALGWLLSAFAALAACWGLRAGERRRSGVQAGAAGGEVVAFGGVAGEH